MSTHTPGPWKVVKRGEIESADGKPIADVAVFVQWYTTDGIKEEVMSWKANAALIAAAPELLYVLQRMVPKFLRYNDEAEELYLEAKSLIKKLTDQ